MEPIALIDSVKAQAVLAARLHVDVNDACPFPFASAAGRLFRQHFLAERNRLLMPAATSHPQPKPETTA